MSRTTASDRRRIKLVVTGPVGAGKTTAITTVSDRPPVSTDEVATDEVAATKERTTVAMDFGVVALASGAEVHLYGTPGQQRFDFMWEILSDGAAGLLVLVDATMPDAPGQLKSFLTTFAPLVDLTGAAVGVTHTDLVPGLDLGLLAAAAAEVRPVPILSVDPRSRDDVALLIESLVATLDPSLVP